MTETTKTIDILLLGSGGLPSLRAVERSTSRRVTEARCRRA